MAASTASGKENTAIPKDAAGAGSLVKMFTEGTKAISSQKTENLFQQLETRSLTEDEQKIIENRVALQRRMLAAYEKQEKARKVQEILGVHAELTAEEAEQALEMCNGREEDATSQLASEPSFLHRIKAAMHAGNVNLGVADEGARPRAVRPITSRSRGARAPKKVDASKLGDQVFVGSFRGRGYDAKRPAPPAKKAKAPKVGIAAVADEDDTAEEEPEALETAGSGENAEDTEVELDLLNGPDDTSDVGILEDDAADPSEEANGPPAISPATEPKRYTLSRRLSNGTVRPVTSSEVNGLDLDGQAPAGGKRPTTTPLSVTSNKTKGPKAAPSVTEAVVKAAVKVLSKQDKTRALKLLQQMQPEVKQAALAALQEVDPAKTEALVLELSKLDSLATIPEGDEAAEPSTAVDTSNKSSAAINEKYAKGKASADKRKTSGTASQAPAISAPEEVPAKRRTRAKPAPKYEEGTDEDDSQTTEEDEGDDDGLPPSRPKGASRKRSQRPPRASKSKALEGFSADDSLMVVSPEDVSEPAVEAPPPKKAKAKAASKPKKAPSKPLADIKEETSKPDNMVLDSELEADKPAGDEQAQSAGDAASPAAETEESPSEAAEGGATVGQAHTAQPGKSASKGPGKGRTAISARGHTNRGRVRQKSHKSAELVEVGKLRPDGGWYNSGYIFPEGFKSRVNFRSSVELDQLCVHECEVLGRSGQYWPAPTFKVVAGDRTDEPLYAKSCTGCWTGVLKRINAEIDARRKAGEDLPPPPKTAIAGPEYFGFNQPEIQDAVEELDPEHKCEEYWFGKSQREAAAAGLPMEAGPRQPRPARTSGPSRRRNKRSRDDSDDDGAVGSDEDGEDESAHMSNKWSAVSRTERYNRRRGTEGGDQYVDKDNPLPTTLDPITLEPVVTPAISPYGHVMGLATWKAVLAEHGKCPFTKNNLSWEQCTVLTNNNIDRYRSRIIK